MSFLSGLGWGEPRKPEGGRRAGPEPHRCDRRGEQRLPEVPAWTVPQGGCSCPLRDASAAGEFQQPSRRHSPFPAPSCSSLRLLSSSPRAGCGGAE